MLAIPAPARIRTATDVLGLHRPWKVALAVKFLRIVDGHARIGPALPRWPDTDDDTVRELWLTGLAASFAAASPDADEAGAATFARVMLTALAIDPPSAIAELWNGARDGNSCEDSDAAYWFLTNWRRLDDPLGVAADTLVEFGAAGRHGPMVDITPLGRWALQEMQARAPKPITADLPADELIARLAEVAEEEAWYAVQPWLVGRNPLQAARDILDAAATSDPAQRIAAVDLVHVLGEPAEVVWGEAAAVPNLAAHARATTWQGSGAQDSAWLAVEYAAAALASAGPDEALSRLDERMPGLGLDALLPALEGGTHPARADLAQSLTVFLASGVTPTVSRAYQLKISLTRMWSPVWRRVLMPATTRLDLLHRVIQVVMDWDGDHLHALTVGRKRYGDPFFSPDLLDEDRLRLVDAFGAVDTISYRYDFGDCWDHTVRCEQVVDLAVGTTYPVCVAGKGESPIEDWTEGPDSTPFDQDEINRRLAGLLRTSPA